VIELMLMPTAGRRTLAE